MADAVEAPPPPPPGRRARGPPREAGQGGAARSAAALPTLPSVSLPDDSSTTTLVLFVLLVVVINAGLLHTVLWGLFMGMLLASCLRVLVLLALVQSDAGALRAALAGATRDADAEASDAERGLQGATPGADGRVNPVVLQMQLLGRELTERDYGALLALDENGGGGAPRRGVPRAALEQMPTHAFHGSAEAQQGGAGGAGGPTCAVCLEDAAEGDELRTLPCLHQFHAACIDRWLEASDCCPVCKHRLLPPTP